MGEIKKDVIDARDEAILLGVFKSFCNKYSEIAKKERLKKILSYTPNRSETVINIFKNEFNHSLNQEENLRMEALVMAFINKSTCRKQIDSFQKLYLLSAQKNKCAICGTPIDIHAHADHIVPFKYVGDELEDNLQMLCAHCNESKNASIDYQIRFLLKLV